MHASLSLSALALLAAVSFAPTSRVAEPAPPAPAAAETYEVDSVHSTILFRVKHLGVAYSYGRFNEMQGKIVVDDANPAASSVEIEAKTDSIDTGNAKRDQHLKSPDFFNAKQFPTVSFKSTSAKKAGEKWEVAGNVTLKGVSKPVTLTLDRVGTAKTPQGHKTGFEGKFAVKRSDFGMSFMPDGLGDEVTLQVSIEAARK